MKLDLLTNATVVDDAIRFVSNRLHGKLRPSRNSNEDDKESKEHDYDVDKDQLEEEEIGEITTAITTTKVF
jgi:hypothetical protein